MVSTSGSLMAKPGPLAPNSGITVRITRATTGSSSPRISRRITQASVAFPAKALAAGGRDLLLVHALDVAGEEPTARREEGDHASVGRACGVRVGALVLRQ